MSQVIYFNERDVVKNRTNVFYINLKKVTNIKQLFDEIGTKLSFELIPNHSWDAFNDQFGEFCENLESDTVIVLNDFKRLSKSYFEISMKLFEMLLDAIREHYQVIYENKNIPEVERLRDNKNISIFIVLK